jgi:hypothetical protein
MDTTLIVGGLILFFAYRRYGKPLPSKDRFTEPMPIGRNIAALGSGALNRPATFMATEPGEFTNLILANRGSGFRK